MNRRLLLPLLSSIAAFAAPSAATAAVSEIGALGTATAGCPGFAQEDCKIVVVRQTGFQAKVGTTKAFTTVPSSGHLVAWTVSLAAVSAAKVKEVGADFGGAPRLAIVVLEPLGKSKFRVVEKGPLTDVTNYLGTTPTFALPTALPVKKGQVVGVTVPSWVPMLQTGLGADTSWRSSKPLKEVVAKDFRTQRALVGDTTEGFFGALYQRARLAYSAAFVPTPPMTPTPKKTPAKK